MVNVIFLWIFARTIYHLSTLSDSLVNGMNIVIKQSNLSGNVDKSHFGVLRNQTDLSMDFRIIPQLQINMSEVGPEEIGN